MQKPISALKFDNPNSNRMKLGKRKQEQGPPLGPSKTAARHQAPARTSELCKAPPPSGKTDQNGHCQAAQNRTAMDF